MEAARFSFNAGLNHGVAIATPVCSLLPLKSSDSITEFAVQIGLDADIG
ncbi:hypothetical protein [Sodalis-like endosymbiont of Proechinophthirus fluctus]|nr:hypothetical protein [Sodalis-like endosymbiont of Proechinophthirus fluctus]